MALKILSVDDEVDLEILLTQYFRRKIKKGEYEFSFAHNGVEALKMLLEHPDFDIILSDINMPEMDGLTLLSKINEMRNPALKCIMVSAYGDMDNIRSAMNQGAFDFTTKPIDLGDLERTIEKAAEQIAFVKKAQEEHSQLTSIQNDLHVAQEIQETILPKELPAFPEDIRRRFDLAAGMKAAKYVGGDFYDYFKIDGTRLGIVIGDVSGKGVPAAIFMAISRTILRTIALSCPSCADCLRQANEILSNDSVEDMFVTVFYGILDLSTGHLKYSNAGHNPPIVIRERDRSGTRRQSAALHRRRHRGHELRRRALRHHPPAEPVLQPCRQSAGPYRQHLSLPRRLHRRRPPVRRHHPARRLLPLTAKQFVHRHILRVLRDKKNLLATITAQGGKNNIMKT